MRKYILITIFCLPVLTLSSQIGSSWAEMQQTDFYNFFNISISEEGKNEDGTYTYYCDPGMFQEEIDIEFTLHDGLISRAMLRVENYWMADAPALSGDIVKSFISDLICENEREKLEELIIAIYNHDNNIADATLADFYQVFEGSAEQMSATFGHCFLSMLNTLDGYFEIQIHKKETNTDLTPQAADKNFFLQPSDLYEWMDISEEDEYMRVFQSSEEVINPNRVVQYIWQLGDHAEAVAYHNSILTENAEYGTEIPDHEIDLQEIHMRMYLIPYDHALHAALGISMKAYIMLFAIKDMAVKLFVSGNAELLQMQAEDVLSKALSRLEK